MGHAQFETESLSRVCEELRITIVSTYGAVPLPQDWARDAHPYKCVLRFDRRTLTVPFYMGSAHTEEPSAADVLMCLASDARCGEDSFEDFCSDLGYDQDSRKAEKTWRACKAIAPRLRRFLGDSFDRVANAEH
jgi:hypothetical protein